MNHYYHCSLPADTANLDKIPCDLPHLGNTRGLVGFGLNINPSTNQSAFTLEDLINKLNIKPNKNFFLHFLDILFFLNNLARKYYIISSVAYNIFPGSKGLLNYSPLFLYIIIIENLKNLLCNF